MLNAIASDGFSLSHTIVKLSCDPVTAAVLTSVSARFCGAFIAKPTMAVSSGVPGLLSRMRLHVTSEV
jgi:hypothetical protein